MEEIISKEEFNRLMKVKGEVRGTTMKNTAKFVFKNEGKGGVEKLEKVMAGFGYPIKYQKLKSGGFYPIVWLGLTLAAVEKLFNYDDEKFQEMGVFRSNFALHVKIFLKYFTSIDKAVKMIPRMWRKIQTVGNLRVVEFSKEKKYGVFRLENYALHPTQCQILKGIFSTFARIVIGKEVTCEETKCPFRGDQYHEFLIKW